MEVYVKIDQEELEIFFDWRKDKKLYQDKADAIERRMKRLGATLEHAIEPPDGESEEFRIKSQPHMDDLWAELLEDDV